MFEKGVMMDCGVLFWSLGIDCRENDILIPCSFLPDNASAIQWW